MSAVEATRPLALRVGAPALGSLALIVGMVTLAIGGTAAVGALFSALTNGTLTLSRLLPLLPLACWGYSLRFLRWHLLVRRAVPNLGWRDSFRAQAIGFGLSVTPGRVAELWKLYLVERATGASAARSAGAMVVERLTDLVGFAGLAVGAGLVASRGLGHSQLIGALAAALVLVIGVVARPFVTRHLAALGPSAVQNLIHGGDAVARPVPIGLALLTLVLGRAGDGLVLWGVLAALGQPVSIPFAVFAFASAGLVGGVSLLPGGLGAVEVTMVGILAAGGVPVQLGLVAALLTRALILWIWVALGLALFAFDHLGNTLAVGQKLVRR
jgi:uncharacterized membrane protein YbhN (UPF0104 family)